MGLSFNADEIFEIAEQIERNGAKFYRKAAKFIADAKAKNLFEQLAKMEDRHLKIFHGMREQLSQEQKAPTVWDPDGEAALYLEAMADGRVFDVSKDPCDMLTGKESAIDVLRMAIGIEKDSVVFYMGMKPLVPAELGTGKVEDIIKEEMRHIGVLNREMRKIV